jgi:nucleoside-triphosphatase THEP1
MEDLKITISGSVGSGKTGLACKLYLFLLNEGVNVTMDDAGEIEPLDLALERTHMRFSAIKNRKSSVKIATQQTSRSFRRNLPHPPTLV